MPPPFRRVAAVAAGRAAVVARVPAPTRPPRHARNCGGAATTPPVTRCERSRRAREPETAPHRRRGTTLAYEWIVDGRIQQQAQSVTAEGKEVVLFLHGLLGSAKDLRAPAQQLTRRLPHLGALLLDVRGHGASPGPHAPPHDFDACVGDVLATLATLGRTGPASPAAVCGHALGGRIALQYARALRAAPPGAGVGAVAPPRQTWVLDALPGREDPYVSEALHAISTLKRSFISKIWLVERLMMTWLRDEGMANWIADKLIRGDEGLHHWEFDLDVANALAAHVPEQDFAEMIRDITLSEEPAGNSAVRLVRAGKNEAWTEEIVAELTSIPSFGNEASSLFRMHTLEKAKHWVHEDDVNGLVELMIDGLRISTSEEALE